MKVAQGGESAAGGRASPGKRSQQTRARLARSEVRRSGRATRQQEGAKTEVPNAAKASAYSNMSRIFFMKLRLSGRLSTREVESSSSSSSRWRRESLLGV